MSTRLHTTALILGATLAVVFAPHAGLAADDDPSLREGPQETDTVVAAAQAIAAPQPRVDLGVGPGARGERGPFTRGGLALPIAETLATNVVMMEWSRWVGAAPWASVSTDSIGRNLRSAWVLDEDDFWVNQVGHPYQGTWSFSAARSSGLGFWASVPFTFGASALWEIAGETTAPSINDQVTTTVAGIALGEILYRFAGALRSEGGAWNDTLATVLSPMSALNHRLLGTSDTLPAPPSRWRFALGSAAFTGPGPSGGREPLPYGGFSFTYGLPGSPGLEIEHPFDHFVVDADWAAAADPAATLRARGLVAGTTFDARLARGVYGAFLSFDFDTPPGHRVSTSAIGFGGSAGASLGRGFALEGDAIASAVLLGAGGTVAPLPDGAVRNYRFGPGQQALLAVRMLAGARARAELSVRQYLLFGADADRGMELLVHATASAVVRIVGGQGIGFELSRYLRRADVMGATVQQADSGVKVYFVFVGGA